MLTRHLGSWCLGDLQPSCSLRGCKATLLARIPGSRVPAAHRCPPQRHGAGCGPAIATDNVLQTYRASERGGNFIAAATKPGIEMLSSRKASLLCTTQMNTHFISLHSFPRTASVERSAEWCFTLFLLSGFKPQSGSSLFYICPSAILTAPSGRRMLCKQL